MSECHWGCLAPLPTGWRLVPQCGTWPQHLRTPPGLIPLLPSPPTQLVDWVMQQRASYAVLDVGISRAHLSVSVQQSQYETRAALMSLMTVGKAVQQGALRKWAGPANDAGEGRRLCLCTL